ncbi:hypothetical protein TWF694_001419 [Orbilia ellipsospora]|uniref:Uncharacterized protein n=1 Tax=Orbilia ellipsospora TaxID=2528407 RepID=A0AAV9XRM3_9PEZI
MGMKLPSNDFYTFTKSDITLILSTAQEPYELSQNSPELVLSSKKFLIYSEQILLKTSLRFPGKEIGLFCNKLILASDRKGPLSIDVSGEDGAPVSANATGPGVPGKNGGNAGSIWLYVRDDVSPLIGQIALKSSGGNGSRGGATSHGSSIGGNGGNGGTAGNIMFLFSSPLWNALTAFKAVYERLKSAKWDTKLASLTEILANAGKTVPENGLFAGPRIYLNLGKAFQDLSYTVTASADVKSVIEKANASSDLVSSRLKALINSEDAETEVNALKAIQNDLESLKSAGSHSVEGLKKSFSKMQPNLDKELEIAVQQIYDEFAETIVSSCKNLEFDVGKSLDANPGHGGGGGNSADILIAAGKRGEDAVQPQGNLQCRHFGGSHTKADLEAFQAFLNADQCRMLLNKANTAFFAGDTENILLAKQLYGNLVDRLYILPALNSSSGRLKKAFEELDTVHKISICSITQLNEILLEASARSNRIALGYDIFGNPPHWVPRLSAKYYGVRAGRFLDTLEKLEATVEKYEEKLRQDATSTVDTKNLLGICQAGIQEATDRLNMLLKENGPLYTSAYKIALYNPIMTKKKALLKDRLKAAEDIIMTAFQVDSAFLMDIFTTLVGTDSKFAAAVNTVKIGYSMSKRNDEILGNDGVTYNKSLVVDKLSTCSGSIGSLCDSIRANTTGTVELDDPGSIKIMATEADTRALIKQFKDALGEKFFQTIESDINGYFDAIRNRNNAVVEFNAVLQLVIEAQNQKKSNEDQKIALAKTGGEAVDPTLPSVTYWMRKARDNLRLDIMELLNCQSRSICYWGLAPNIPFRNPGLLPGYQLLKNSELTLEKLFDDVWKNYASFMKSTWPDETDRNELGKIVELTAEQLAQLKQPDSNQRHTTYVTLAPDTPGFEGMANVRLTQVRVWLPGAMVKLDAVERQPITTNITHLGKEIMVPPIGETMLFDHDAVDIDFTYESKGLVTKMDIKSNAAMGRQSIDSDYRGGDSPPTEDSFAPIGPFTTWRIVLDAARNPGLDLSRVSQGFMEFSGMNRPRKLS